MANNNEKLSGLNCIFCGKPKEIVNKLIAGPNGVLI